MKKTNTEAIKVYKERRKNIDRLINELQKKLEKHGNESEIHWGHAGDLGYIAEILREINESMS